ncbi:TolC family protein [Maribacter sp. X9]|uniref:TolC family protein n=1 Tax=Maribacter sp. X9 TaxID=3402159 RepID=UPI003AF3AAF3
MKYLIHITFRTAFLLLMLQGYAQTDTIQKWRWQSISQKNVALFIGTDTITKTAEPLTGNKEWWKSFGYKQLDSLIGLAIKNNIDVKIAQTKIEQARAQKRIVMSTLFPSIKLEPSVMRQELSGNRPNPFGGQLNRVNLNTFEVPLVLNYKLDIFGENIDQVKANKLLTSSREENKKDITLQVLTEVAQNYFLLLQLDAEKNLLKETEETRIHNLEITTVRNGAGLVSQIDVLRAKSELSSVQVQQKNNEKLRSEIELILALLTGADATSFTIAPTTIEFMPPEILLLEKDMVAATRPDLKAAILRLESSEKLARSQKKQLLPSFYASGSYGYLSGNSSNLIENNSKNWAAGITASLPIFEGGKKRSEIKLRESELNESKERYNQQLLLSYQQIENSYAQLNWVHEQLLAQQEFVSAAIDAASLTGERYRKGLVNYIDVVDAERQVLEAEQLSVQLFGQELIGRVTLIRALGITP